MCSPEEYVPYPVETALMHVGYSQLVGLSALEGRSRFKNVLELIKNLISSFYYTIGIFYTFQPRRSSRRSIHAIYWDPI
jgi:hypothetical protein